MNKITDEDKKKYKISRTLLKEESIKPLDKGLPQYLHPAMEYIHSEIERKDANNNLKMSRIFDSTTIPDTLFDMKILELQKRDLYEEFISADIGMRENRPAESTLIERMKDDTNQCVAMEYQIRNVKNDINVCKTLKLLMEEYIEKYSKFEKFLKSVADNSEAFNSVGDVLNRYEMLEATRKDIADILKDELDSENELRRNMANLIGDQARNLTKLRNKLIKLHTACREAKERRRHWELNVDKIKSFTEEKVEEDAALKGACAGLYRKLCKSRGHIPTIADDNIEQQLAYIRKEIAYKKDIYNVGIAIKPLQKAGVYNKNQFVTHLLKPVKSILNEETHIDMKSLKN